MSEPAGHTWTCAGCGRRVPRRAPVCHCGTTRERSLALERPQAPLPPAAADGWRGVWRSFPRDVKVMIAAAAAIVALGLGWLALGPRRPDTTPALLGYVERPAASRRPAPAAAKAPLRLPWWK